MSEATARARLFWWSAAGALALHAVVLFATGPLHGGGDLDPHLRLIELMAEAPGLRSTYPPAYHAAGALLSPLVSESDFPKWFGLASAVGLIAGFRFFQRAAGLPDACSALFAWAPYAFALSWCLPKIEAAGYAVGFAALGLLLQGRYALLAGALAATFWIHTATALFLGLCGGVLALLRRDRRALLALAMGTLGGLPLFLAHLAAGCTAAQSLLFSPGDYLRSAARASSADHSLRIAALAGPIAVVAAISGARSLWRQDRAVTGLCALVVALYLNELWLSPFGVGTTLNLQRGLTVLAFPVAVAGGVALSGSARLAAAVVAASAVWAIGAAYWAVPGSCWVKPIEMSAIGSLSVDRCMFRWRGPGPRPSGGAPRAATGAGPSGPERADSRAVSLGREPDSGFGSRFRVLHGPDLRDSCEGRCTQSTARGASTSTCALPESMQTAVLVDTIGRARCPAARSPRRTRFGSADFGSAGRTRQSGPNRVRRSGPPIGSGD